MKIAVLGYLQSNGKTLMIHRNKREIDMHKGKWNGLGGKIKEGETPEEALVREFNEESGLNIKNPLLKGVLTFPSNVGFEKDSWLVFIYTINEFEGELIESEEGYLEWIDDDKILDLRLQEGDKYFLPLLTGDRFFSGRFVYGDNRLIEHSIVFH